MPRHLIKVDNRKVTLLKSTTWRCGKCERGIIKYLLKRNEWVSEHPTVNEINETLPNNDEFRDALKRLERRQILLIN
jgi:outer membrane protein assembly factor BamD (BamD/ComL family)